MHAWEIFLTSLESDLGKDTVRKWLRTLKVARFDACNLYLEAKDAFQALWFEEHVRPKIISSFTNNNGRRIKVHLAVAGVMPVNKRQKKAPAATLQSPPRFSLNFDELDPYYLLSTYALFPSNEMTFKLLEQLCSTPSQEQFNPIFLYGGEGTGKTHLLMATAAQLRKNGIGALYVRAETFTDHVVSAIRAGEMSLFRQAYRNSDVLIVDDVHVFSRKWATQEEFFHTFNTLHLAGKQMILSANCSPAELQMIEPRLVSRFEWGIALGLEQPSPEQYAEILSRKAEALHFPLNPKIKDFLIETFKRSPKSLIKSLEALILRTHLNESYHNTPLTALTVPQVKQCLADLIQDETLNALTPAKILHHVAAHFGIKLEDLQGRSQTRDFVLPRQIAMYLCRKKLKIPFIKIGELFNKDHSTVMSSVRVVESRIDSNDPEFASPFAAIVKKL